jgi:GNAT superfamily N-acetyltransferase
MLDFSVRQPSLRDSSQLESLLSEWLGWKPRSGRSNSIRRAIRNKEILVAVTKSQVVGFIHFALHEDVIDGAPNAFITAFYVTEQCRGKGVGTELLHQAIIKSARRGATFIETSTVHSRAREFYEGRGFRQTTGDIGEVFLELDVTKYLELR